ncbi:hypothetical protein CPT_Saba_002 [Proteus phage Saba]|uniref:Uncharacterized protein n=1 Tax=Proteus phage Saba TaxID=2596672 RepID=A0A5B9N998_9CAUD|nr:hypothetical protein JT320_gp02 [Proteus phage Saba]QEG09375.1 hypothetical protein CPT_Saba_002 [Proteus phage Saba]
MLVSEVPGRLRALGIESIFQAVKAKDISTCTLAPMMIEEGEELVIELNASILGFNPVVIKVKLTDTAGTPEVRAWRVQSWDVAEAKILQFIR